MLGKIFYLNHLRLRLPSASVKYVRERVKMEKRVRANLLQVRSIVVGISIRDLSPEETHYESLHLFPVNIILAGGSQASSL
jgi:hypothetical protein